MPICKCSASGFEGDPYSFPATRTAYHDMRCPECGSTNIDTSDINQEWARQGRRYGYGDNNVLDTSPRRSERDTDAPA